VEDIMIKLILLFFILTSCFRSHHPLDGFKCEFIDISKNIIGRGIGKYCFKSYPDGTEEKCYAEKIEWWQDAKYVEKNRKCKDNPKKDCPYKEAQVQQYWTPYNCNKGLKNDPAPQKYEIPYPDENKPITKNYDPSGICKLKAAQIGTEWHFSNEQMKGYILECEAGSHATEDLLKKLSE
jgi:hypothetical protein